MCFKGVGVISILCTLCNHWVHKRCGGLKNKLVSVINFKCKACLDPRVNVFDREAVELNGNKHEVVKQFCYLDNMISAEGGAEANTVVCVRSGWKSCLRQECYGYDSEAWSLKEEDITSIFRTDKMIR